MGFHDIQRETDDVSSCFRVTLRELRAGVYSVMHMIRISEVTSNHGEPIHASPEVTLVHRPSKDRKRSRPAAPGQVRRELEEQKLLLKDPNHIRTVQRWVKVDGERQATTKQQAVRPWWKIDPPVRLSSIKFGAKLMEFEKGKAGIVVQSKDKLLARRSSDLHERS
jgi:hypothetical protein